MKKIFTLLFLAIGFTAAHAQTVIYTQTFNTSATDWSMNTADVGGTTSLSGNQWLINNIYAAGPFGTPTATEPATITGGPTSNYLHMNCGPTYSGAFGQNCNYYAASSGETYFAAMNTPVVTTGYTGVSFTFWWLCNGSASAAGKVYYRTAAAGAWTQITTPISTYYGSSSWALQTITMAAFDNKAFLEFGFQFTDEAGSDPAFGIDDIRVVGTSSTTTGPTAAFTYAPNDTVCQDSCITFTNTSTGTVDSIKWIVAPGGTTAPFPTVNPFTKCFSSPGSYTVVLTAFGGAAFDTASAFITVKQSPHPVITKAGHVLTVSGTGYTNYKWYNGATVIAGATNNSYTYTGSGVFSVKVDSNGCTGMSNVINTVGVGQLNGGDNTYWIAGSDYSSITLRSTLPTDDPLQIIVADPAGRVVARDTWNAGDNIKNISATNLPPGLYIIRLSSSGGTSSVLKLQQR